jgi:hypothetical protein
MSLSSSFVLQSHPRRTSPIRIHLRYTVVTARLPLEINLRHVLTARVADLIVSYGHYDTNRRRAKGRASPITKKYETRFNLERCRFDYRLGSLWH